MGRPGPPPWAACLLGPGFRACTWMPGQALVELDGRRDLAGHEAEVGREPRGQGRGGKVEGQAIGQVGEDHGGEGQDELPVLGGRSAPGVSSTSASRADLAAGSAVIMLSPGAPGRG